MVSHKYLETDNFFEDIFVKSNAPEILAKELGKKKWNKSPVNICGISDCYQPVEAQYRIMPRVIKSFIMNRNPLVIVTKSTLPLRDIELIKELNNVSEVSVVISVSTLDEKKRVLTEPNAAPTVERLNMLNEFNKIGCKTAVLLMPIMPYISDDQENLDEIFRITKDHNLGSITSWPLHLRGNTKNVFYSFLREYFSELLPRYKVLYKGGNVSEEYRFNIQRKIRNLRDKYQLYSIYRPTQPEPEEWTQPTLFE